MKLYDLEAFARNKCPGAGEPRDEVLLDDVKFEVILDENIIPPLEALKGAADRELILSRQRVIAQVRVEHPPIMVKVQEAAGPVGLPPATCEPVAEEPCSVEYEELGTLPEGAFWFRGHVAFLHVDKRGRVQQVDLVRKRKEVTPPGPPVNREFKNMLVQDVKTRRWDELTALFSGDA
ncbi:MAG: hypothetical protein JW839_22590 [Candidatus Lokiarchaeota archaeon]|nr:hypothetical protein [Candidatus Lokiarchaeota archaeon]